MGNSNNNETNLTIISPDKLLELVNTAVKSAIKESIHQSLKTEIKEVIDPLRQEISNFTGIKIYSVKELANILNLNEKTITKYCKDGTIKSSKKGSSYITTHQNLMKFLEPEQKNSSSDLKSKKT